MLSKLILALLGIIVAAGAFAFHANAEPPKHPQKWEQYCTRQERPMTSFSELLDAANRDMKDKGNTGWELAGITAYSENGHALVYCFKRPGQ